MNSSWKQKQAVLCIHNEYYDHIKVDQFLLCAVALLDTNNDRCTVTLNQWKFVITPMYTLLTSSNIHITVIRQAVKQRSTLLSYCVYLNLGF